MDGELSLLVKPVSADCNMHCRYCFYRRPTDPYRSAERHLMDDGTLRTMISRYMQWSGRGAAFGWQGGEPLLAGLDFFRRVVAYQQFYGRPGQLVGNNLQTNGLLIDDGWAGFFRRYHFFVGVSLDGPEAYHSAYRHAADGCDGFAQTLRGIQTLRDHGVAFSILSVVNDVTARRPAEIYEFFLGRGWDRLQFIPCLEFDPRTGAMAGHSVSAGDYRDFLCTLFDLWYNGGRPVSSIRLFENILAVYMGAEPEICSFRDRCGSYWVVEYNGDVYPCDFFVEEGWLLGNLRESSIDDLLKRRRTREFNGGKAKSTQGCRSCEWNFICHHGCRHYRTPAGENYFCHAYRDFFRYTRSRFEMLAAGLAQAAPPGAAPTGPINPRHPDTIKAGQS